MYKFFGFLFLTFSTSSFAASYYVSSTGSDLNAGTSIATAWATITKVNSSVFLPGDALYFEGGQTFNGSIFLSSTEANDPNSIFTISSYGTGKATINAGTSYGFYAYNTQGFSLSNLIFDGNNTATNTGAGILVYADLPGNVTFSNITIANCEVKNFGAEGVKVYAFTGLTGYQNLSLSNLSVHDVTKNGIEIYGFLPRTPDNQWPNKNVTVSNCEVYNVPGSGLQHEGNGIVISGVDGGTIQNCVVHNTGQANTFCGGPVGIWSLESNNVTIQYCESYNNHRGSTAGCDGGGFDLDGGVTNSFMQYNYSHDNEGAGFLIGQYPNANKWNNNTVRFNISQNDGIQNKGSIDLFKGPGSASMSGAYIYENTIYVSPQPANGGLSAVNFENWSTGISNVFFYNNVFIATATVPLVVVPSGYSAFFAGNIYWPTAGNFSIHYQGTNYTSLSSWRTATGNEIVSGSSTGFSGNPLLTNVGSGGTIGYGTSLSSLNAYKIQSALSPAYQTALDLHALYGIDVGSMDFWGTILPSGIADDIGANEFVSILPTQLLGFYGNCSGQVDHISWSTAEESNMKSYDLMYSADGRHFKKLVSILPNGSFSSYHYTNDSTSPGNNYYQLSMVDMDGSVSLSTVLNISCGSPTEQVKVWPNPFNQVVHVSITSLSAGPATLTLYDVMGKLLSRREVQIQEGIHQFNLSELGNLPTGTYYLQIDHLDKPSHFKLLKTSN